MRHRKNRKSPMIGIVALASMAVSVTSPAAVRVLPTLITPQREMMSEAAVAQLTSLVQRLCISSECSPLLLAQSSESDKVARPFVQEKGPSFIRLKPKPKFDLDNDVGPGTTGGIKRKVARPFVQEKGPSFIRLKPKPKNNELGVPDKSVPLERSLVAPGATSK